MLTPGASGPFPAAAAERLARPPPADTRSDLKAYHDESLPWRLGSQLAAELRLVEWVGTVLAFHVVPDSRGPVSPVLLTLPLMNPSIALASVSVLEIGQACAVRTGCFPN